MTLPGIAFSGPRLRGVKLVSNGEISNENLDSPGELVFNARGELFVAGTDRRAAF